MNLQEKKLKKKGVWLKVQKYLKIGLKINTFLCVHLVSVANTLEKALFQIQWPTLMMEFLAVLPKKNMVRCVLKKILKVVNL